MMMKIKQCSRCLEAKPVSEFYVSKTISDGFTGKCKKCCGYYQLDYVNNHKEKVRTYQREYQKKRRANKKPKQLAPIPETFYQIDNYPNYYVSHEKQQVWSRLHNRYLKLFLINCGYYGIGLSNEHGKKNFLFHRVLAETFIPNPNNYPDINHLNGNKLDNTLSNIEWTTPKLNANHAILTGLFDPKEHYHLRRKKNITKEQALEIRNNPDRLTQKQLGEKFNLSVCSISKIHRNKCWKNI
jgi:hypothetical protein